MKRIFRYLHLAALTVLCLLVLLAIQVALLEDSSSSKSAASPSGSSSARSVAATVADRLLPSCIIIGVRKGGTRALLDMLSLHSSIRAAKTEVHFFDVDENYRKGYSWYKQHLPPAENSHVVVEKSPNYFVSRSVPQRVHRMNSTVHLLLVVRDPVTRLISDYTQILHNHLEKGLVFKSFSEAALHPNGSVNTAYDAVSKSLYAAFLPRWLHFFPLSQIHVVNGDQLIRKPWRELQKVESFLGLGSEIRQDMFFFNATKGFHCIQRRGREKCLTKSKGRPHPKVPDGVVKKLRKFYAPHNYRFYNMVGKDFGWPEE